MTAAAAMARLKKAPAPAMVVAAAALLVILLASAPRAQGGGEDCKSIPLFKECLSKKGVTLPPDPNSPTVLSGECCNAFADGERDCLCRLRNELRDRGADPKKLLCPAYTGCP